jgi:5-(carboxyamino)imidazole ribonucleotide synthase
VTDGARPDLEPLPPGSTIGIVGGGQLGRMSALAARPLGFRVIVLDPQEDCPASGVADYHLIAPFDDARALDELARESDVVTFEFENVPAAGLERLRALAPVHPSPEVLATCRDRELEKTFLVKHGFPVAAHRFASWASELEDAARALGTPSVAKATTLGYDGKSQALLESPEDAARVFQAIGSDRVVLERLVPFDAELSVSVARNERGEHRSFAPSRNAHSQHVLDVTTVPAGFPAAVERRAMEIADGIADALELVGVLAVELFLVGDDLLVNELAPRPHNSYHHSIESCVTSQFEQHVRSICGLPLGDTRLVRPAAMANLLGDLWAGGEPQWSRVLGASDAHLHLYGKRDPRPGRKMAHLTVLDDDAATAARRVRELRAALVAQTPIG